MSDVAANGPGPSGADHDVVELRKEAFTMALYVAICLLAALSVLPAQTTANEVNAFKIVWGTSLGLAAAHWFAFRVSALLIASGTLRRQDAEAAAAQLAGAAFVSLLATIPIVLLPGDIEVDVTTFVLAAFIGVVGYAVARTSGAGRARSAVYGAVILVVAALVVLVKNALVGH